MFWSLRQNAMRVGRLFLDKRVPGALKAATVLGALVIVSPIDLLGDLPVIGMFDDVALLGLLALLFLRLCPREVVEEYMPAAATAGRSLKNVTPS